jgi:haloalkane dehalogenase
MDRRQFLATAASSLILAAASPPGSDQLADTLHAEEFRKRRQYARLRQGNVAYFEAGSGPAALFLHGFPLNSFQWRHAIERLAPFRRCIAPDFLAMGYTEVAQGQGVGPLDQVRMVVSLMDALDVRQADFIANDSGGAVAQLLVAHHGERVRSLLLTNCDSAIESPPAALLPVIELSRRGEFVDAWLGKWRRDKALARSPEGIGGMCYSDPAHPTDAAIEYYSLRCSHRQGARPGSMPMHWRWSKMRSLLSSPCCAEPQSRCASFGGAPTRSSLPPARSISTELSRIQRACASCPDASSSGRRRIQA